MSKAQGVIGRDEVRVPFAVVIQGVDELRREDASAGRVIRDELDHTPGAAVIELSAGVILGQSSDVEM